MANVSIHYIIYNKERHQDGKYPIKLRFTYKRIPTIVATNLFAMEGELVAQDAYKEALDYFKIRF